MKQVKKILFPIDFAENYDTLLPWVATFVEKFGATLYVVFVTQDLASYSTFYVPHGNIQSFQEQAQAAAKKRMAAAVFRAVLGKIPRNIASCRSPLAPAFNPKSSCRSRDWRGLRPRAIPAIKA